MTRISALTALTSADAADTLPILDDSATTTKKITKTAFLSDIVDGTLLADDSILARHIAGTAWTTWTPTWTNLTVGNATQSCKYQQFGKTVNCRLSLVMGSTTVVGSDPTFTLPVTRAAYGGTANVTLLGSGHGYDTSANILFLLTVGNATTTTSSLRTYLTNGTHTSTDTVRSNNPFLWATGDEFGATFTYEAE